MYIIHSLEKTDFLPPVTFGLEEPKSLNILLSTQSPLHWASSCPGSNPFGVTWLVTAFYFYFFFSWISGGSWDKSSHEVVEVYPICALCQPPWGWAGCDLSLWLFSASYGRKNVLPYTWRKGNIVFFRVRMLVPFMELWKHLLLINNKLWLI